MQAESNKIPEPKSTNMYSFEADEDQLLLFRVSAGYSQTDASDIGVNIPVSISATVTDPSGIVLWEQKNVQWADDGSPLRMQKGGKYQVEIVNNQNRPLHGGFTVTEFIRTPHMDFYYTMVIFLSLPVITLAIWLFAVRR